MPLVYAELQSVARGLMHGERASHTLQATALVHEAWLRLSGGSAAPAKDREHFRAVAARAMRNILVDHARARQAEKRGGELAALPLDPDLAQLPAATDPLELDELLHRLAEKDPELARIVELRFFGGLTVEETGRVLGLTRRQVDHAWTLARAWLHRELRRGETMP